MTTPRRSVEKCTFCGKSRHAVESLIAGPPGIYICNECVELCNTILLEELKRGGRTGKPKPPAPVEGRPGVALVESPAVVVVDGHGERALGAVLADHVLVEVGEDLARLAEASLLAEDG